MYISLLASGCVHFSLLQTIVIGWVDICSFSAGLQYPAGTLEVPFGGEPESPITVGRNMSACKQQGAYVGSCKHHVWEAIRASSAAPYYLDDFSDGNLFVA